MSEISNKVQCLMFRPIPNLPHCTKWRLVEKNLLLTTDSPCLWGSEWFPIVLIAHTRPLARHLILADVFFIIWWWMESLAPILCHKSWSAHTSSSGGSCPILEFRILGCAPISYLWWVQKSYDFIVFMSLSRC